MACRIVTRLGVSYWTPLVHAAKAFQAIAAVKAKAFAPAPVVGATASSTLLK